ncbi:MAG: hypothetical protein RR204_02795 [Raoultibacter sp.]
MSGVVKSKQNTTNIKFIEVARQLDIFTLRMTDPLHQGVRAYCVKAWGILQPECSWKNLAAEQDGTGHASRRGIHRGVYGQVYLCFFAKLSGTGRAGFQHWYRL